MSFFVPKPPPDRDMPDNRSGYNSGDGEYKKAAVAVLVMLSIIFLAGAAAVTFCVVK